MYIYLNSEYVKAEDAKISIFDHGFLYGLGVFETFRVYKGHPFLLKDHLKRLQRSLDELGIDYLVKLEDVKEIIEGLLERNSLQQEDVSIRFNVSAGAGGEILADQIFGNPTVFCFMRQLSSGTNQAKKGVLLQTKRSTPEGRFRMKSHHYMNNFMGKKETGNHPGAEGIFLTQDGHVAEGIVSSLFWVKNRKVCTPSLQTGILDGITRRFILTLLDRLSIPCEEGLYKVSEMLSADEVFAVNSVQEIIPFSIIESVSFPGMEGEIAELLKKNYSNCRTQLWSKDEL
ncbi:aminodeoxychorismate lyase [Metabacillus sp. RGM 3146]|uniref:aminodeoxychorismate lyase n=1 Tax=Metabacillus sp. RGM 3146 TaxID=3401092 RepID=UPI003B99291A